HLPSSIHLFSFFLHSLCHPPVLHSFPTRRSSDLLFQMRFYALAIWRAQGRVPSMLQLIYLGNGEIVRYQPDEADLLATERKVEALWQAIERAHRGRDWRPRPGRTCEWGAHPARCPAFR